VEKNRGLAISAGTLFIMATVASIAGTLLANPIVGDLDLLTKTGAGATQIAAGALLAIVAAGASVGIAISLYPIVRKVSPGLAIGSVAFRTIEAVMYALGGAALLALASLGQDTATASDGATTHAIGTTLLNVREAVGIPGVLAFSVGALLYYMAFYRAKLIPRWLSVWGIVGVALMIVASTAAALTQQSVLEYAILALPIAVQEMVLAVWLITRGWSREARLLTDIGFAASAP